MASNKFKNLFSGINRTSEQLINSVLNNTNSSINSAATDTEVITNSFLEDKERSSSLASSNNDSETNDSFKTTEAEGFLCPQCFAAFPNAEILTEHFSSEHSTFGDQNLFINCSHCKMRFTNDKELIIHIEKYHDTNVKPSKKTDNKNSPLIAQLDQLTTKQLTDSFSQVLQSAINNSSINKNIDVEKMVSVEEFDLLQRQQKALEETKDLLLNELSLLRKELNKKDQIVEKVENDFQKEKQLLIVQLNESLQNEKALKENVNNLKNEILKRDDEMNRLKDDNKNLIFEKKRLEDQNEKLQDEKIQNEKLCQQLKDECNVNQKVILEMTTKTYDSLNVMTKEKSDLNDKIHQLQFELDSSKKYNKELETQVEYFYVKNFDSSEYGKQLEKIETLRKQELDDHRSEIKQLKSDKIKFQNFYRTKIDRIRSTCLSELATLKLIRSNIDENHKIIEKYQQEYKNFAQDELNKHLLYPNDQIKILIKERDQLRNENKILVDKIRQLMTKMDQLEQDFQQKRLKLDKRCEELLKNIEKYQNEMNKYKQSIQILTQSKSSLEQTIKQLNVTIENNQKNHQQELDENIKKWNKLVTSIETLRQKIYTQSSIMKSTLNGFRSSCDDLNQTLRIKSLSQLNKEAISIKDTLIETFNEIQNRYREKTNELNEIKDELKSLQCKYQKMVQVILPEKQEKLEKLTKSEAMMASYMHSMKITMKEMESREEASKKWIEQLQQEKQSLMAENEKEKARYENIQKFHEQVLGEKLKLEIELSTFVEEKRILLERCVAAEEELETTVQSMKELNTKFEENVKAIHELGMQNQTLQIKLVETNNKLRRSWTDDNSVDKCMNEQCQKQFTTVIRKHHCRNCGNIFCNECSSKQAQVTGHPKPVRVCDECYQELDQL